MSLFDKLIEGLGNIGSTVFVNYCSLCKKECDKTIELSIQECTNFDLLLDVVLCEDCFKKALELMFND